jgi:hypothetical protein
VRLLSINLSALSYGAFDLLCSFLGVILVLSELRMPKFDVVLRNNFGFLYGFKGKAAFLVL